MLYEMFHRRMYARRPSVVRRKRASASRLAPGTRAQVARIARHVVDRQIEDKHLFTSSGTTSIPLSSPGTMYALSQIGQGVSDNQRVGDQVRLKELQIRMRIGSTSTTIGCFRYLVFMHKGLADSTHPIAQSPIYEAVTQDYLTALSPLDPKYFPSQGKLFADVLYGISTTGDSQYTKTLVIPLRDIMQTYTGSTYSTNSLYIVFYGQTVTTATGFSFDADLVYRDA